MRGHAVAESPKHACNGHGSDFQALAFRNIVVVKKHSLGRPKASFGPGRGQRQVHLSWKCIREVVEHERGFMRENPCLFRPEPDCDEVLMLAGRKVNDAVDATSNAPDSAVAEVFAKELRGITGLGCLRCREVSLLSDGKVEEAIPVRCRFSAGKHSTKRNPGFSFVQTQS